jgi:hypothetical protein
MATMTVSVSIVSAEDTDNAEASTCGKVLIFLSWVLVFLTMPISLLVCFKVSFLLLVIIGDKRKAHKGMAQISTSYSSLLAHL